MTWGGRDTEPAGCPSAGVTWIGREDGRGGGGAVGGAVGAQAAWSGHGATGWIRASDHIKYGCGSIFCEDLFGRVPVLASVATWASASTARRHGQATCTSRGGRTSVVLAAARTAALRAPPRSACPSATPPPPPSRSSSFSPRSPRPHLFAGRHGAAVGPRRVGAAQAAGHDRPRPPGGRVVPGRRRQRAPQVRYVDGATDETLVSGTGWVVPFWGGGSGGGRPWAVPRRRCAPFLSADCAAYWRVWGAAWGVAMG